MQSKPVVIVAIVVLLLAFGGFLFNRKDIVASSSGTETYVPANTDPEIEKAMKEDMARMEADRSLPAKDYQIPQFAYTLQIPSDWKEVPPRYDGLFASIASPDGTFHVDFETKDSLEAFPSFESLYKAASAVRAGVEERMLHANYAYPGAQGDEGIIENSFMSVTGVKLLYLYGGAGETVGIRIESVDPIGAGMRSVAIIVPQISKDRKHRYLIIHTDGSARTEQMILEGANVRYHEVQPSPKFCC